MSLSVSTVGPLAVAVAFLALHGAYWMSVAALLGPPDDGPCGYWTSGGPGRLVPWPSPPGMLAVITPMYPWDVPVCVAYETGLFVVLAGGTVFAGWFVVRAAASRRSPVA